MIRSGSRLRAEMAEQPQVLRRLLEQGWPAVQRAASAIRSKQPPALLLAGRGSSGHAALYARYLFEVRNRVPVSLAAASVFTLYRRPPRLERLAAIAVSQSGQTAEGIQILNEVTRQGGLTVAVTNDEAAPLARAADLVLPCLAGPELSLAATKTLSASMLLLAMLSEALDPDPRLRRALTRVPEAVEEMLSREDEIAPLAGAVAERRLVILGRGYNLASACEIALKLKEISGAIAESESGAEFMHGPIAMVEGDVTVMVVEAEGPSLSTLRDVAAGLRARGARVVRFSDAIDLHDGAASLFRMPAVLPEELTPIPFIVAGQLLATEVALARGRDPDHVAGLQKVTQTL